MAPRAMKIFQAIVAALLWASAAGQSSCDIALVSLAPCLNYISGNSMTHSSNCCSQLASMLQSQPQCLCRVLNGEASTNFGVPINQTQALALPEACRVQTPAGLCNGSSDRHGGSNSTTSDSSDGRRNKGIMSIVFSALIFCSSLASLAI